MRIRVVLVGVEGPVNLGVIARTCANFGVKELYLVNPVASVEEALTYSAGGREILASAKIVSDLAVALEGVDVSVATSAIGYSEGDMLRQAVPIGEFVDKVLPRVDSVALVFGRESTGLTREEIKIADFLVTIPADPAYPVLNISQSVAIFLWEIWKRKETASSNIPPRATKEALREILGALEDISSRIFSTQDKVEKSMVLWRRILSRASLSAYEARFLKYWVMRVRKRVLSPSGEL